MSRAKRQHYVPRCLLKHFCADGQTINVTDLKTNKTYQTNITNVAQENRFYDFKTMNGDISLEDSFSGLEAKTAPIIDRIVSTESIAWFTDKDFQILEDFIVCQFYRTRKSVNFVKRVLLSDNIPLFDHFNAKGEKVKTIYTNDIDIDDNVSRIMAYNVLHHMEHNDVVRDAIASMEWLLMKAPDDRCFIVSDSPAVLGSRMSPSEYKGEHAGFELPDAQIMLPISSKLMLVLSAKQMVDKKKDDLLRIMMTGVHVDISDVFRCCVTGNVCRCPDRWVTLFNETQKRNAERFVYRKCT